MRQGAHTGWGGNWKVKKDVRRRISVGSCGMRCWFTSHLYKAAGTRWVRTVAWSRPPGTHQAQTSSRQEWPSPPSILKTKWSGNCEILWRRKIGQSELFIWAAGSLLGWWVKHALDAFYTIQHVVLWVEDHWIPKTWKGSEKHFLSKLFSFGPHQVKKEKWLQSIKQQFLFSWIFLKSHWSPKKKAKKVDKHANYHFQSQNHTHWRHAQRFLQMHHAIWSCNPSFTSRL